MIKTCLRCGGEFRTFPCYEKEGRGIYCSKKCSRIALLPALNEKRLIAFESGKKFGRPKKEITIQCIICNIDFMCRNSVAKKTCSKLCFAKYSSLLKTGFKHSQETKNKLKEIRKTSPPQGFIANPKYGKDNPKWKGGVTAINEKIRKSPEYNYWRKCVYERDNYACVLCGQKGTGRNLNADHIKPFSTHPKLRFDIDNGRTLCIPCHRKTPTYGFLLFNKSTKVYTKTFPQKGADENISLKF